MRRMKYDMRSAVSRHLINRRLFLFCTVRKSMKVIQNPLSQLRSILIHGNIPGTVEDNFPEISRDSEDV